MCCVEVRIWCSKLDLNQHGLTATRPSSVRVYHSTIRAVFTNLEEKGLFAKSYLMKEV